MAVVKVEGEKWKAKVFVDTVASPMGGGGGGWEDYVVSLFSLSLVNLRAKINTWTSQS